MRNFLLCRWRQVVGATISTTSRAYMLSTCSNVADDRECIPPFGRHQPSLYAHASFKMTNRSLFLSHSVRPALRSPLVFSSQQLIFFPLESYGYIYAKQSLCLALTVLRSVVYCTLCQLA